MFRKILVPLDGSPLAEAVLPYVRDLARCNDAEIVLLRVATYPLFDYSITDPRLIIELRENAEAEARSYINMVATELKGEDFQVVSKVVEGTVADAIVEFSQTVKADLIAMSTHGRTGISSFFLGSVANRVVHESRVPVLLIHPEKIKRPSQPPAREKVKA